MSIIIVISITLTTLWFGVEDVSLLRDRAVRPWRQLQLRPWDKRTARSPHSCAAERGWCQALLLWGRDSMGYGGHMGTWGRELDIFRKSLFDAVNGMETQVRNFLSYRSMRTRMFDPKLADFPGKVAFRRHQAFRWRQVVGKSRSCWPLRRQRWGDLFSSRSFMRFMLIVWKPFVWSNSSIDDRGQSRFHLGILMHGH